MRIGFAARRIHLQEFYRKQTAFIYEAEVAIRGKSQFAIVHQERCQDDRIDCREIQALPVSGGADCDIHRDGHDLYARKI